MAQNSDKQFDEEETARRRDAALRRALNTPHQPHKTIGKRKQNPKRMKPAKNRS